MMLDKLPKNFDCNNGILEAYTKLERDVLPYLIKKSRKLAASIPSIDFDDALQEGKIAIIVALASYDPVKAATTGPGPYVWTVVKNAYFSMAYEAMMKSKIPHIKRMRDGKQCNLPSFPISLDALLEDDYGQSDTNAILGTDNANPERDAADALMRSEVGKFTMKMYNKLTGIDYKVFRCKVHPPRDFLDMLYVDGVDFVHRNESGMLVLSEDFNISFEQIGKYLGVNKNVVGWALYKIRGLFLDMARNDDQFIELFDDLVIDKRWPAIHQSVGKNENLEFKRRILKDRKLDLSQSGEIEYAVSDQKCSNGMPYYSRLIKWYAWGAIVTLKKDDMYHTIICEGRFNKNTGDVFGFVMTGAHVKLELPWYRQAVKVLKDVK